MAKNVNFKEVASRLLFGQQPITDKELIDEFKLEYRAGKTATDIKNSIKKAHRNGNYKVEYELDFLELYLSQVFKKKEKETQDNTV